MKKLLQIIEKRFKLIAVFLLGLILITFFDKALAIGLLLLFVSLFLTLSFVKKSGWSSKYLVILLLIALTINLVATLFIHYTNFQPFGLVGDGDFNTYHEGATEFSSRFKQGNFSLEGLDFKMSHYFSVVIGVLYALTLPEMIIGQLLGVWFSILTILFVYLIVFELGASKKWAFLIGLIAISYPSFLFYNSLLLKDTIVIPFALLTMLLILKLTKGFSWRNFLFFILSLGVVFHFRFYIAYALLFSFLLSWLLLIKLSSVRKKIIYSIIIIAILGSLPAVLKRDNLNIEKITLYQEKARASSDKSSPTNTSYGGYASTWKKEEVNIKENLSGFLINQLKYFSYALLGPFPWQMRYSRHLFALVETIPWYILLFFIGKGIWEAIRFRNKLIFPLLVFCALTLGVMGFFLNNFGVITRIRIPVFMMLLCLIPLGFKRYFGEKKS